MPARKIDLMQLKKCLEAKMTQAAIARELGVSEGAVSKNVRALGFAQAGDVVMVEAVKINQKKLDAMTQLERINLAIQKQLDEIQTELQNAKGTEKADLRDAQIKHTGEIRKQLSLLLEISKTLYDIEQVKNFQETVLEELGNADPKLRERVLKALRRRRDSRSIFDTGRPSI